MELISPLLVNIMAVIAIAAGLVIGAWWIVGLYCVHGRDKEKELPEVSLPSEMREVVTGAPPVLTIFYVFIVLALVGYVLYIWLGGISY